MAKRLVQCALFRFGIASLIALLLDLALVLVLVNIWNLSLPIAAGLAFVIVGIVFYFVHEHWTFKRQHSNTSSSRLARSLSTQLVSLAIRVGVIALLDVALAEPPFPNKQSIQIIIWSIGVAASFSTNFLLNKFWVFR